MRIAKETASRRGCRQVRAHASVSIVVVVSGHCGEVHFQILDPRLIVFVRRYDSLAKVVPRLLRYHAIRRVVLPIPVFFLFR